MRNINTEISFTARLTGSFYFQGPSAYVRTSRGAREPGEIIVMLAGVYRATYGEGEATRVVEARPGDVLYWPPGARRVEDNPGGVLNRCLALYFRWRTAPPAAPCIRDRGQLILRLAERITEWHQENRPDTVEARNLFLNALLAHYLDAAALREPPLVRRLTRHIDEHLDRPARLAEIADQLNLELHHLCRAYKRLTGRTVMEDVRRRKVEHARHLLLTDPEKTLAQIAARVGIGDEHQLSRLLKRYTRQTAREWRRFAIATRPSDSP